MRIYSITTKDTKGYRHEVGVMVENEDKRFVNLYMFPDTTFQVNEKQDDPKRMDKETA
jgi:hypothetical protein